MWMQRLTTTDVICQTAGRTGGIIGRCVSVLRASQRDDESFCGGTES